MHILPLPIVHIPLHCNIRLVPKKRFNFLMHIMPDSNSPHNTALQLEYTFKKYTFEKYFIPKKKMNDYMHILLLPIVHIPMDYN